MGSACCRQSPETDSNTDEAEKPKMGPIDTIRAFYHRIRYLTEDWVFLFLLGAIMSVVALILDFFSDKANTFHSWAFYQANQIDIGVWRILATLSVWVMFFVIMLGLAALLTRLISPPAIGSGIPELKTIFRGVILKEYLTIRTMIAKFIGLAFVLGAGVPLGKEGPLVHMSAVVASQLSRLVHSFQGIYENESRSSEMLAAGCAVGVACAFTAPVGGVLFSIEVTSVFFAVRNYWRGFFAAVCAATITRIVTTLIKDHDLDMNTLYQTHFPTGKAYTLQELPIFALIGVVMGFAGAAFILCHRKVILFMRTKAFFQRYWMLYPLLVAFFYGLFTYPEALGQFMSGSLKFTKANPDFFTNCTWSNTTYGETCGEEVTDNWTGLSHNNSIFVNLCVFQVVLFVLSVFCGTLPVPCGSLSAAMGLGAAFGRTIGEIVAVCLEGQIESGGNYQTIYPGVYAVVGAAAFSGSLTQTISISVIIFEVTGQMVTSLPVMISVIIAVAVSTYLQPSIYDSVIMMKNLPYLPDIRHSPSIFHTITVDRIMVSPVQCIPKDCTYRHIRRVLDNYPKLRALPVVDSTVSMALLGSVNRNTLLKMIDDQLTATRRKEEERKREAVVRATSKTISNMAMFGIGLVAQHKANDADSDSSRRRSSESGDVIIDMEEVNNNESTAGNIKNSDEGHSYTISVLNGRTKAESTSSARLISDVARRYAKTIIGGILNNVTRSDSFSGMEKTAEPQSFGNLLKLHNTMNVDNAALDETIDFNSIVIDTTPFQIVSHSSLFKVHSLFSLLGLNRAYIMEHGKLVGVVALKEIREAIEKGQSGQLLPSDKVKHADVEQGGETKQDKTVNEEYDNSSDYEDNIQGKLEVVPRLEEATEIVASDHLQLQLMRHSMGSRESSVSNLSRRESERARWRMDEMATRRRTWSSRIERL